LKRVYRILRRGFAKRPFDGEGPYLFGGRWSSPGTRLVYTSEHLSLAMIEFFVHIEASDPPTDLVLVSADVPDSVSRSTISVRSLISTWRQSPAPPEFSLIGDQFVRSGRSAILIVPSVLAPSESNWLINPAHSEFARIQVNAPEPFHYDGRFFE
jgi:RES domain-containing protein